MFFLSIYTKRPIATLSPPLHISTKSLRCPIPNITIPSPTQNHHETTNNSHITEKTRGATPCRSTNLVFSEPCSSVSTTRISSENSYLMPNTAERPLSKQTQGRINRPTPPPTTPPLTLNPTPQNANSISKPHPPHPTSPSGPNPCVPAPLSPVREKRVPRHDDGPDACRPGVSEHPGLPPFRVMVGV